MEHDLFTFAVQGKQRQGRRWVERGGRERMGCVKINNNNCARIIKAKQMAEEEEQAVVGGLGRGGVGEGVGQGLRQGLRGKLQQPARGTKFKS